MLSLLIAAKLCCQRAYFAIRHTLDAHTPPFDATCYAIITPYAAADAAQRRYAAADMMPP